MSYNTSTEDCQYINPEIIGTETSATYVMTASRCTTTYSFIENGISHGDTMIILIMYFACFVGVSSGLWVFFNKKR
jgi:hypothetical protein